MPKALQFKLPTLSFGLRLGVAVTALTVSLTTVSVYHFYKQTQTLMRQQITGRLRDIGHTSTFMLSNADRDAIVQLKVNLERDAHTTPADAARIPPGKVLSSLTPAQIQAYQASPEIQRLMQWLRKIKLASLDQIRPLQDHYPQQFSALPDGVLAYILIETPESADGKVLKFLASADPDPEPPIWPGNPTGDLYAPVVPIFRDAFNGKFQVAEDYYTDQFYTSLTAVVPIKDKTGKVIAVLGLDYIAGTEQDYLQKLQPICLTIIVISAVISMALSYLLSRYFATLRIENRELKDYSHKLEQMVQERTLSLQTANQTLQELASIDSVTKIFNHRYFDNYLQAEWQQAEQEKTPLSLILCDVDHFKIYNDTYGHPMGDFCLQQVAKCLERCIHQSGERVARYGGEEFAVLLPDTDTARAMLVAETIRTQVKALNLEHRASTTSSVLTLSMGVASVQPGDGGTIDQLIEMADKGLYQAKQAGRDQVSIYALESQPVDQTVTIA
jgi:diguanylate cyclase (GGDEF)-like protein